MPREDYSPVTGNHTKNTHSYQGHAYVSDGTYRMLDFGNLDLQIETSAKPYPILYYSCF